MSKSSITDRPPRLSLPRGETPDHLARRLLDGDRRALARAITYIENRDPRARDVLRGIYPSTGKARIIGLTGAPGVGKSTMVAALGRAFRDLNLRVGIVAVDPTSPFSGGALLGDRVRMGSGGSDDGLFFRSVATRGQLGGVSRATGSVVHVLDAAGYDVILLETVGAGQSEVEIMRFAHTVLVIAVPGLGDEVQAFKAGILEIADVFVVNKADRPDADRTAAELDMMIGLAPDHQGWRPPVIKTVARDGQGIDEVMAAVARHREFLAGTDLLARRSHELAERQLVDGAAERLVATLRLLAEEGGHWRRAVRDIVERRQDPDSVVESLLQQPDLLHAVIARIAAGRDEAGGA
ncbi:MAG: methylmalonyl Co-A mutase-associated GTPase MeaB [Thermaerobacterales bacterium]